MTLVQEADLESFVHDIDEYGYCMIPDVLGADELRALRAALDRATEEDDAAGTAQRYGPNLSNQRVWALLNRGDEFVRLALQPLALILTRRFLGPDILLSQMSA